jgi:hypothetical protein
LPGVPAGEEFHAASEPVLPRDAQWSR